MRLVNYTMCVRSHTNRLPVLRYVPYRILYYFERPFCRYLGSRVQNAFDAVRVTGQNVSVRIVLSICIVFCHFLVPNSVDDKYAGWLLPVLLTFRLQRNPLILKWNLVPRTCFSFQLVLFLVSRKKRIRPFPRFFDFRFRKCTNWSKTKTVSELKPLRLSHNFITTNRLIHDTLWIVYL